MSDRSRGRLSTERGTLPISGLGIGLIVVLMVLVGRRLKVASTQTLAYVVLVLSTGAVLAKAIHVYGMEWRGMEWHDLAESWNLWRGGRSILGFAVAPALLWYLTRCLGLRSSKLDALTSAAYLVFPVGQSVGRVSCLLNGCCYGRPTGTNVGIVYPPDTFAGQWFGSRPLHPVQAYEAILDLFLFAGLALMWRWKGDLRLVPGLYLAGYGAIRLGTQHLRADGWHTLGRLGIDLPTVLSVAALVSGLTTLTALAVFRAEPSESGLE